MLSANEDAEPRFQISDGPGTQLVFGMDVEDWTAGDNQAVGTEAYGYPIENLSQIYPGLIELLITAGILIAPPSQDSAGECLHIRLQAKDITRQSLCWRLSGQT